MAEDVIRVERLGKQYQIGTPHARHRSFRERLATGCIRCFRQFQRVGQDGTNDIHTEMIWALKDISFQVEQGEVLGVIGRNGSGKSTLLKILSGITDPTTGEADITGRVGSLLEVGTGFHPELSGRENIYLNGAVLGIKKAEIENKFDAIVAFSEVEKFIDTPVKFYSSGMYMRLAFAVAAHLEPEILLLDEVLAVGDAAFQQKCLGAMGAVANEGRTIVFVSHNLAAIRNLCSRTLFLESGHLIKAGPTEEVMGYYLQRHSTSLAAAVALPAGLPEAPGVGRVLRFLTQDGMPQAQFRLGEPWRIAIEFELFCPVPQVIAAVGLISLDSVPLLTYWSKSKDLKPGHYSVEFDCKLPFSACDIQFVVSLSSYQRPFYHIQGVGHVSISPVAVNEQPLRSSGTGVLFSTQQPEILAITLEDDRAREDIVDVLQLVPEKHSF
ncbi:MAG: polysaccharide ABC transporter ATP-binding protein [Nitrospira sp.]|nr:polysaccharide ABC transporter ATP-binding protein [Nitrospira sp.]